MTDERLADLESLCETATPDPWTWIAAARIAVPELIAEVRQLRAELARLRPPGELPPKIPAPPPHHPELIG